jgi:hypothetical protein
MNTNELKSIQNKSIYSFHISDQIKDAYLQKYLTELHKSIKQNIKKKNMIVILLEINS